MVGIARDRFDARAEEWAEYYLKPLGRIRHEVIWSNLAPHLPPLVGADKEPRILDVGGGTGELAIQLARSGYRVCLLDFAPAMLEHARLAIQNLSDNTRRRLELTLGSVQDAPHLFPTASFDAITCHTLVDYLPDPQATLASLLPLLRRPGLLSLTFVNHHSEVQHQVLALDDPAGALDNLHGSYRRTGLFEVSGQAYTVEEGESWLVNLGLTPTARYGVRCFADFVEPARLQEPAFFDALLRLEQAVATLTPYSLVARYVHFIARRDDGHTS
jgi:S-adenosylmethionine-dependent methyltransferase